jgi:hypothetical protein
MSRSIASELARRLAREAEAVCRRYLSNGRREGSYWLVGDVRNEPGRSLYVRLKGPLNGKGAAGKWVDCATGEHGDLLDIIRETCRLREFPEVIGEARRFLSVPKLASEPVTTQFRTGPNPMGAREPARRLFAMSQPIAGTRAETYLRHRGISALYEAGALRFHPHCYYRAEKSASTAAWPAMIAAVTDLSGSVTGVQRTWLDRSGERKAPIETPRRAMGCLLGNGVRFGVANDVLAAGEGIETVLSLRCVTPTLPMIAALSSAHLAAIVIPATLRRLYVVRDNDAAGDGAARILVERATAVGIDAIVLAPILNDFNDDLRYLGEDELRAAIRGQIAPEDVARFFIDSA